MNYERVREILNYNKDTGELTWKIRKSQKCKEGDRAGSLHRTGYRTVYLDGKSYLAHRIIWLWQYGYLPEEEIDHINRDKADNRLENLREISRSCNCFNRPSVGCLTGITKDGERYRVRITVDGNKIHIGRFHDFAEAVAHRLAAEEVLDIGRYLETPAKIYMNKYLEKTIEGI